jgi:hypothetical protein
VTEGQTGEIQYTFKETERGVWRMYDYDDGRRFREYMSKDRIAGWPLIHYTFGKDPETERRIIARGIIAVGRISVGALAVGHAAFGLLAIGQAAVGLIFLAQLGLGLAGIGQVAISLFFAIGQVATGYIAVGQVAIGYYCLGQVGVGKFVYAMNRQDPEAYQFFKWFLDLFMKKS